MKLSELSGATGVSTATLKYYLREGLLPAGAPVSRTQADYGERHLERVRLIRALIESGGLSIAQVRSAIGALDGAAANRLDLLGVAQEALVTTVAVEPDSEWTAIAREFVLGRGWQIRPDDPLLPRLGVQLRALVEVSGDTGGIATLDRWAEAAESIARTDLDTLPEEPSAALKQVVVGTALSDPVLLTLRRLAQQAESARRFG